MKFRCLLILFCFSVLLYSFGWDITSCLEPYCCYLLTDCSHSMLQRFRSLETVLSNSQSCDSITPISNSYELKELVIKISERAKFIAQPDFSNFESCFQKSLFFLDNFVQDIFLQLLNFSTLKTLPLTANKLSDMKLRLPINSRELEQLNLAQNSFLEVLRQALRETAYTLIKLNLSLTSIAVIGSNDFTSLIAIPEIDLSSKFIWMKLIRMNTVWITEMLSKIEGLLKSL